MKLKLAAIAIAIAVTGCASTKNEGDGPVKTQKLATSFVGEKIKIETNKTLITKLFFIEQLEK